jgi:hypothetical protein
MNFELESSVKNRTLWKSQAFKLEQNAATLNLFAFCSGTKKPAN